MDRTKVSGAFDLGSTPNGGAFLTAICILQAAVFVFIECLQYSLL